MADIADFFVDFITNNRVGQICNMHVIQADQTPEGARDKDCGTHSRLAAQATDFPKTGHPVDMDAAPRVSMRPKPDFISQRSEGSVDATGKRRYQPPDNTLYYRSEKALGRMYRAVNIQQLLDKLIFNGKGNENGPRELWRDVERRLRNVKPSYQFEWPTYLAKAKSTFQYYVTQLNIIKRRFHPRPWMGESLREEEVFLQCIEIDADKKKLRGRGAYDFLDGLKIEYGELVHEISKCSGTQREKFIWFSACFYVGITESDGCKEGESFAWLVIPDLFESNRKLEKIIAEEEVTSGKR
jgi:hypothetical protein